MLGFYEDFPAYPHAKADFNCAAATKTLKKAILTTTYTLNQQEFDLKTVADTKINCRIGFEFGIAEKTCFNYLDREEIERFERYLNNKENVVSTDFLCILKYHKTNTGKRQPLRFDNYMLRFVFRKPVIQLNVFHEKGTQRLSMEELIEFLMNQINAELKRMEAKPLRLVSLKHPVPIER